MYLENVLFKGRHQPIVPPSFLRHAHETPARSLAGSHGRRICDSAFVLQKGDVTVRIAHSSQDLHLAEGLVKERYAWRGYQLPTPHVHHPLRKTFLASSGTQLPSAPPSSTQPAIRASANTASASAAVRAMLMMDSPIASLPWVWRTG